jgi:hypothetical protein
VVLRSSLVVNKRIFNNIALSFLIFLIIILIAIFIFLILLFILLLIRFLCIYCCIIFCLSLLFNSSLSSSFFFILLINIRIYAFYKGLCLKTPKLRLKALVCFNNISFKIVLGVSNKVFNRTKHAFTFSVY